MLILLPPSESKAVRTRGARLDLPSLSWPELTPARTAVQAALAQVSERPDAAEILGVSPNLADEIARNTRLATAPTLPASALYTGVLYDALDLPSLTGADKARATRRIAISSALYGAVRLTDRLAPYRLSMSVNLPDVGPLASFWKPVLDGPLTAAAGKGLIIDCRSSTYVASWAPSGDVSHRWIHIRVPGATHMAKHTRGLLARYLVTQRADPTQPQALLDLTRTMFDAELHEPASPRKPWIMDVSTR